MEKQEFDKKIQELIAGFKENYDPKSWDSFEKKLKFEEEMDALIKSSVDEHTEPFNEAHWDLLIEEIQRRKVRTIVKRCSEVVIILLLILTTQNFIQFKNFGKDKRRDIVTMAQLDVGILQLDNLLDFDGSSFHNESSVGPESGIRNNRLFSSLTNENLALSEKNENETVNEQNEIVGFDISLQDNAKVSSTSGISNILPDELIGNDNNTSSDLVTLDVLGIEELETSEIDLIYNSDIIVTPFKNSQNGLWVSIIAGPDVNFINSPFDLSLLSNPVQSQSGALSLGATVSRDIGNLELMSGLIFSSKNYFPYRIREFIPSLDQKYFESNLRSLEFNQVQIPLLVHYHSPRTSGMSIYGTMGLGVNVITNTYYDIETQLRSFAGTSSSTKGGQSLNLRDLPQGLFQSGSIGDNVYTSAIVGFGIEKRFNNKVAITVLTSYQRSISKEINPIINRTQQLGVTTGIKVNLK